MRARIFQLDTFTARHFAGNPAAVVPLDAFPADAVLQAIAAENNLSETAFLVSSGDGYELRWFTPKMEVALCGHATLASAAVVIERLEPKRKSVSFDTASGPLIVGKAGEGYEMDLPARSCRPADAPAGLETALGAAPVELAWDGFNLIARLGDAAELRALAPDFAALARLPCAGIAVTALSDAPGFDFVSRYFAPAKGINEDPATGGAHCGLAPFWAARLGRRAFRARQESARGGEMSCRLEGDRVVLEGRCVFYLEGEILF